MVRTTMVGIMLFAAMAFVGSFNSTAFAGSDHKAHESTKTSDKCGKVKAGEKCCKKDMKKCTKCCLDAGSSNCAEKCKAKKDGSKAKKGSDHKHNHDHKK